MKYFVVILLLIYLNARSQPAGFSFCKSVTIHASEVEGNTDFNNFPVLFNMADPDLATVSNGGYITDSINPDIVFTYNSVILDHEVEFYDRSGQLIVWVKVPTLFANVDTELNLCYGNCDGSTAGNNVFLQTLYKSVLHLSANPSSNLFDSSLNGNNGVSQGGMSSSNVSVGQIHTSISFDEVDDAIIISDFDYTNNNGFSVSFWFNVTDNLGNGYQYLFSHGSFATFESISTYIPENGVGIPGYPGILKTVFQDINDGTNFDGLDAGNQLVGWHYYVLSVDPLGDARLYIDGTLSINLVFQGGDSFNPNTDIYLGGRSDLHASRFYGGELDEFRLMNTSRSDDFILTEFNNQANNAAFFSVGSKVPTGTENFDCTTLPIDLLDFNAIINKNHVELSWITLSEINNDYFTIEKSRDAHTFEEVMVVNGAGNSSSIINYFEIDYELKEGVTYYRLKQTDFNGKYTYSKVVPVKYSKGSYSFTIFPNPTDGNQFKVKIKGVNNDGILLIIRDMKGRECYSKLLKGKNTNEYIITPQHTFSKGVYNIVGTSNNDLFNGKLIVK